MRLQLCRTAEEHGAEDHAGRAAHAVQHCHTGALEDAADVRKRAVRRKRFLCVLHAARHADAMVAVADLAVHLGEIVLILNDRLTCCKQHVGCLLTSQGLFHPVTPPRT